MLPGDAELVSRDPWLPGMPLALDDHELTVWLRAAWPSDAPRPDAARVRYLRYKPRTLLVARVDLEFDGRRTPALLETSSLRATSKLDKLRRYAAEHPGDVPLIADVGLPLVLSPITGDRRLPALRRLSKRVQRAEPSLRGCTLTVLAYKPHRRLVARADVDGEPVAVVKVHRRDALADVTAALHWSGRSRAERLHLPQLLAEDEEHGLVVTTWRAGAALDDQVPDRRRATLRGVGKLLGRLHRADAAGLSSAAGATTGHETLVRAISRTVPELGRTASRALDGAPTSKGCAVIHGDLSPDQVVHGDDGVHLIDLDRTGLGCPEADLASWIAASLTAGDPSADAATLPAALWEGYRSVDGPATEDGVAAQLPAALLRRAIEPFRTRVPDWAERLEATVCRAAQLATAS